MICRQGYKYAFNQWVASVSLNYRRMGNIDVNNELHLAQTRTILNLTSQEEINPIIVSNKKISDVRFVLDLLDNQQISPKEGITYSFKYLISIFEKEYNLSFIDFFNK